MMSFGMAIPQNLSLGSFNPGNQAWLSTGEPPTHWNNRNRLNINLMSSLPYPQTLELFDAGDPGLGLLSGDGEDGFNESDWNIVGNASMGELPYFPYYIKTTSTLLCVIILVVGIIGNVLVPIVVWRNKDLRSSTNIFLVNLSIADLLVLIVCVPTGLVELHTEPEVWVLGETMCKLVPFAELSVAHASVLTILAISLERYIAICRPLRANYTCTKQRAVGICIAIWIIGLIATSPMLAIAKHKRMRYIDRSLRSACLMEARNVWSSFYFLSSIALFFFLPLFLLIALYWVISRNLMSDPCNTSASSRSVSGIDHPNMRARKQVVMMLATVVLFFFICLLPFRIFSVYIILAPSSSVSDMGEELYYNILYFCRVMLYVNSAINPILYNVMSSKFREAFFKVLGCPIGTRGRGRWLCRHLSRQSTFNTTSTHLANSSVKSNGFHSGKILASAHNYHGPNGDSCRVRELTEASSSRNGCGRHNSALRTASGPYYPNGPKRQHSSDGVMQHTHHVALPLKGKTVKKVVIRANSVV